jgi:hypothetical protein
MNESMEGPTIVFQRSWSVPFVLMAVLVVAIVLFVGLPLLPPGSVPPIIGDILQGEGNSDEVTETETPQMTETPSPTQEPPTRTPTPTLTPTNTPTVTPTPTATPTPRVWTEAQFNRFMFNEKGRFAYVFLQYGWHLYDGIELMDDFPCIRSCYYDWEEARRVAREAFEQNNNADFWCEWACQALDNHFGRPYIGQISDYYTLNDVFGNEAVEPFCPQFVGSFEDFSCNVPKPTPTPLPLVSLGWSEEVRDEIEEKYLYQIIKSGVWDRYPGWYFPTWPNEFTDEDVEALPDSLVCWVIANGHYYWGFPEYDIPVTQKDDSMIHELRLELREKLNMELGESVDGNPPLCPGFLDMIDNPYFP